MFKEIVVAIQSFFDAHRFIRTHNLWKWILIPGLTYFLLFCGGMYFFWVTASHAIQLIFTETGLKAWLDGMHAEYLNFFIIIGHIIIWIVLLFFYFSVFKFLFLIIGSPLFAYLSEKTEKIIAGSEFHFSWSQLFTDMARAIRIATRNFFWQLLYIFSIFILSLIPLAGWVTPLLSFLVECYYFGFAMLDYSFERHKVPASRSIHFIGRYKGLAIGNGLMFFGMHLIPVVGWLFAPSYAVVAATLSLLKFNNPDNPFKKQ